MESRVKLGGRAAALPPSLPMPARTADSGARASRWVVAGDSAPQRP